MRAHKDEVKPRVPALRANGSAVPVQLGRPTLYSPEVVDEILRRVSLGEALGQVCSDPHIPAEATVRSWIGSDRDGLSAKYARSKELQMDVWADRIIEVAYNSELEPNDRRVKIDTMKWLMSKFSRRFADKLVHQGDDAHPIIVQHQQIGQLVEALSPAQLDALVLFTSTLQTATDAESVDISAS